MNRKIGCFLWLIFALNKGYQYYFIVPNWFSSYADDLLFLPLFFSSVLWVQQKISGNNFVFKPAQIWLTFLFFSFVFEVIYPKVLLAYTSDPFDVLMYFLGTLLFIFIQKSQEKNSKE